MPTRPTPPLDEQTKWRMRQAASQTDVRKKDNPEILGGDLEVQNRTRRRGSALPGPSSSSTARSRSPPTSGIRLTPRVPPTPPPPKLARTAPITEEEKDRAWLEMAERNIEHARARRDPSSEHYSGDRHYRMSPQTITPSADRQPAPPGFPQRPPGMPGMMPPPAPPSAKADTDDAGRRRHTRGVEQSRQGPAAQQPLFPDPTPAKSTPPLPPPPAPPSRSSSTEGYPGAPWRRGQHPAPWNQGQPDPKGGRR